MKPDPSKLQVMDGLCQVNGTPLPQLHPNQIGPVSSGFVLMSAREAEPYLKAGKQVSTEPFAFVVFHHSTTCPCS
jgi:hypothetical protein